MASFKGIKERINSVKTTRKITSAMKMVSAAKLHRAQRAIGNMLLYSEALNRILAGAACTSDSLSIPLSRHREVKRAAVVAFSSDSSLAGSFNSNIVRELRNVLDGYRGLGKENILVYTVGKKVFEAVGKLGYSVTANFDGLAAKPDYSVIADLGAELEKKFLAGELDRVELIYHHFKSAGSQELVRCDLLPLPLPGAAATGEHAKDGKYYIFEPSQERIIAELMPKTLRLRLYTALLDSAASEHAARVIAMQAATENADQLINELTVEYNKSRQQAITNELLDMMGGQMQ